MLKDNTLVYILIVIISISGVLKSNRLVKLEHRVKDLEAQNFEAHISTLQQVP